MARRPEHPPGSPAPLSGRYEQLNVFGTSTGIRVNVRAGETLPVTPRGHCWVLVEEDSEEA